MLERGGPSGPRQLKPASLAPVRVRGRSLREGRSNRASARAAQMNHPRDCRIARRFAFSGSHASYRDYTWGVCHASSAEPCTVLRCPPSSGSRQDSHNRTLGTCEIVLRLWALLVLVPERKSPSTMAEGACRHAVVSYNEARCVARSPSLRRDHDAEYVEGVYRHIRTGHGNVTRQSSSAIVLPKLKHVRKRPVDKGRRSRTGLFQAHSLSAACPSCVGCVASLHRYTDTPGSITCYTVIGIYNVCTRL